MRWNGSSCWILPSGEHRHLAFIDGKESQEWSPFSERSRAAFSLPLGGQDQRWGRNQPFAIIINVYSAVWVGGILQRTGAQVLAPFPWP